MAVRSLRSTPQPHKIRFLDFLPPRYCRSLRFRWCSLHTSLPGFHPSGNPPLGLLAFGRSNVRPHMGTGFGFASLGVPAQNPLYSVKVLVCSCVYSDSVSVRDKERYVYNSTCLKCSRFCTALSSIAFF